MTFNIYYRSFLFGDKRAATSVDQTSFFLLYFPSYFPIPPRFSTFRYSRGRAFKLASDGGEHQ